MPTRTIKQSAIINASPHHVYEALMDSKKHASFTKSPARISRKVGGSFSAYDGYIVGKNLKLVKDKKIVQKWRGTDWPDGHYSTATFQVSKKGKGAMLKFTQTNVPSSDYKDKVSGWKLFYWKPMKKMLEK